MARGGVGPEEPGPTEGWSTVVDELISTDVPASVLRAPRESRPSQRAYGRTNAFTFPLWTYVGSRLLVVACAFFSVTFVDPEPGSGPWPRLPGPHTAVLRAFGRWDAAWYLDVARAGYHPVRFGATRHASTAFFPGYPLVLRTVSTLTGTPLLVAAVVVTAVFGAVASIVLWHLVAEVADEDAARRAVILFCFSPGAFVLSMGYSEGLFLAAASAAILLLLRRRWRAAGALTAVAAFVRPNGVALVLTCAVVAYFAVRYDHDRSAIAAPAIGALGTATYFGFVFVRTGDPFGWFTAERQGWGDRIAPVSGLVHHLQGLSNTSLETGHLNDLVWLAALPIGGALLVLLLQWRPPLPILVYGIAASALAVGSYQVGLRPRMLLSAFPLVLAAGVRLRGTAYYVVLGSSVACLIVLSVLTFGTLAVFP